MPNPDYRALCAELLVLAEESSSYRVQAKEAVQLIDRARALLAQPEPAELTEQELWQIWDDIDTTIPDILRAAIAADRARRIPEAKP